MLLLTPAATALAGLDRRSAMTHSIVRIGLPLLAIAAAGCATMGTGTRLDPQRSRPGDLQLEQPGRHQGKDGCNAG